jgi:hypothetical protein
VARLRAGQTIAAPPGIRRSPTYAWDYAQCLCELIAQECEGVFNTAGPTILGRLGYLRLLARAFDCELGLVREGSAAAFLRAGENGPPGEIEPSPPLPANTALCDRKASFVLGRCAVDPFSGHRLMRRQLEELLGAGGGVRESSPAVGEREPNSDPGAAGGREPQIPRGAH